MIKNLRIYDATMKEDGTLGVDAISLVDFPAIEKNFIALSKQEIKLKAIDEERRIVVGPLLIPEKLIYRVDEKTKEEYYVRYSAEVIAQVAHDFMKKANQHNATVQHALDVEGVTLVETWVKEFDQDKSVGFGFDEPVGTWFGMQKIDNDAVWNDVKSGTFKGFSIEGHFDFVFNGATANILEEIEQSLSKLLAQVD